ncbi:MAG: hypothetical protein ACXU9Z_01435 [Gemmatimonadaceae bacterium]
MYSAIPRDTNGTFDTKHIVKESFEHAKTFAQGVELAKSKLKTGLETLFHSLKLENAAEYEWALEGETLQVAFAKIEDGKPVFAVLDFKVREQQTEIIERSCPSELCGQGRLFKLGLHDHIDKSGSKTGPMEDVLRSLIQLEIDAHPDMVGGPIDVLQIDPKGSYWLLGGHFCSFYAERKSSRSDHLRDREH